MILDTNATIDSLLKSGDIKRASELAEGFPRQREKLDMAITNNKINNFFSKGK